MDLAEAQGERGGCVGAGIYLADRPIGSRSQHHQPGASNRPLSENNHPMCRQLSAAASVGASLGPERLRRIHARRAPRRREQRQAGRENEHDGDDRERGRIER